MGARCDPYWSTCRAPLLAKGSCSLRQFRIDGEVEFDRASHFDALGAGTEATKALGFGFRLRGDQTQFGQHWGSQAGETCIASRRTFGQPCIGQSHWNATLRTLVNVVGPQFGFHHYSQLWLDAVEEASGCPGQVVGKVAVLDAVAEQRLDPFGTGWGHASDGDRQFGIAGHQFADHRCGGDALPYRYRMHPDTARLERRQPNGKALANAF